MAPGILLKFLAYGTGDAQLRTVFMSPMHSGAAVIAAVRSGVGQAWEYAESDRCGTKRMACKSPHTLFLSSWVCPHWHDLVDFDVFSRLTLNT